MRNSGTNGTRIAGQVKQTPEPVFAKAKSERGQKRAGSRYECPLIKVGRLGLFRTRVYWALVNIRRARGGLQNADRRVLPLESKMPLDGFVSAIVDIICAGPR